MNSNNPDSESRVSIVSVETPGSERPPNIPVGTRRPTEKAPLLSQRRLFSSLGGFSGNRSSASNNGAAADSTGGYTEFSSSMGENLSGNRTLGTFAGVFCPVALSMFSALLFLRVGFIVGNSGVISSLISFTIAYGILLFTVFSICAISTNGAVEGGGAYFMISRTLGPELGGSIGTLFVFANVVSSALYVTGCVEGIVDNFGTGGILVPEDSGLPNTSWYRFLYCSGVNFLNLIVCLVGASLFAKTSAVVLGTVLVSLMSILVSYFRSGPLEIPLPDGNDIAKKLNETVGNFTGFSGETFHGNVYSHYGQDYTAGGDDVNFAVVFGVLFSGVTGIMAGANMSGDLKSPGRSIPRGTLSAMGFTYIVYILITFLTAATCSNFLLRNNYIFMLGINFWPPFVSVGILTAAFSASLSNLIGASRVLEAVAKDDIFGPLLRFVTNGTSASGNPIAAVVVCFVVVEMFLLIGSLNVIAQLNSVLFLLSYFAMNLACLGLDLASAPNFRPAFKYFSAHTAFIGMIGSLTMMFLINPIYASLSIIACLVLVILLHLFSPARSENWGSISQALIFHQVRKYLLLLDSRKDHVKFWRPQMLLMVANPRAACPLIDFVNNLKKSGLYVLGHVEIGDFDSMDSDAAADEYSNWLALVDHLKVKAFIELTVARSVREGMHHLIRLSGLGAMKPNTIVFGFHDDCQPVDFFHLTSNTPMAYKTDKFEDTFHLRGDSEGSRTSSNDYVAMIKDVIKMNKNVCLCRGMSSLDKAAISRNKSLFIDVWPINFFSGDANSLMDATSLFLLQLACVLNMTQSWKGAPMRVFLCTTVASKESENREAELRRMLQILRIKASIVVVPWDDALKIQLPAGFPADQSNPMESSPQWPVISIKMDYLKSVNELIRKYSVSSAVSFLYLPAPPVSSSENSLYLSLLSQLSEDIGPSVMVHGVSPVTSTTI